MLEEYHALEKPASRSRRGWLFWFLLGVATTSGVVFGYRFWQGVNLKDPYVQWQTAEMIVEYMEQNQNRWPTSWDDLEKTKKGKYPGNTNFSIEELKQLIVIDWNADPQVLAKAISRRSRSSGYGMGQPLMCQEPSPTPSFSTT